MRLQLVKLIPFLGLLIGFNAFSQNVHHDYQDGLVLFQLKESTKVILSQDDRKVDYNNIEYLKSLSTFGVEEVIRLHPNIKDNKLRRTYQVKLSNPQLVDQVVRHLDAKPEIKFAELKEFHRTQLTPNDQFFDNTNMWGLFQVDAELAWDLSTGDANVVVAVTDNAIDTNHPDLTNKMLPGQNTAEGTNDPNPCGGNNGFHGSHVAGTVGAETDNSIGVASIGWDISILPVAIGRCSDGALTGGFDGIIWSADNGADVINMSWGGGGSSNYGQQVCDYAWNQGCILVAAAGNDGTTQQFYPAAYNNVISVAATDQNDQKANFSQYGTWLDISAPGVQIASTDNNNGYQFSQGTSMASPLVAGFMGLMKSYAPNATNTDLINCLYSGADNIDAQNPSYVGLLGAGRMNAYESLICAQQFSVSDDAGITDIIYPTASVCTSTFTPEIVLRNFGGNTLTSVTITYEWNGTPATLSWTGSLATGQTEVVVLPNQTAANGNYTFTAATSDPNGVTDQNPSNDESTQNFNVDSDGQLVDFELILDCFGSEITWEITDDNNNNAVVYSGGGYLDNTNGQTINETFCMSAGCYTFNINDSYGDGMYGSQWGSCAIDGDYSMTDANGALLFEMTAPNADFGFGTSHQFCITNQSVLNDAGIQSIIEPGGTVCDNSIVPIVELRNYGADPLTSVDINYQTTGGVQVFSWTGNLTTGQTENVTLPAINVNAGQITLDVFTSNPNGLTDDDPSNDDDNLNIIVQTSALALPFTEDFESNPFADPGWIIDNPDNGITWELATVNGNTPGNTAAKMDFYNYQQASQRDGMLLPLISLAGYASVDMYFEHAYRRYDQTAADSLIVYISSDCGENFDRLAAYAEDGTGSFATQTTNQNPFTPDVIEDWCLEPIIINGNPVGADCFIINLDDYLEMDVIIKFESFNAGNVGNNLFIDNINIDGVPNNNPPTPNFSVNTNTICEGGTVDFTDQSTSDITAWNWTFPGGVPGTSTDQHPSVMYPDAGTYDVILEVTNANGTESATFTNEITVNTTPTVTTSATNLEVCEGNSTQLTASGATSYTWDNGLGTGSTKTVTPTATTTYTVTGSNGTGCEDQNSITIVVNPIPTVTATATDLTICEGTSTTLQGAGANTYTWDNGLGAGQNHTVSPVTNTVYNVTGTDAQGCTNTASVIITVDELPNLTVSSGANTICEGNQTSLTASGADTYSWTPTAGLSDPNAASLNAAPTTTTTYTVEGTNSCGSVTESITISVDPAPNMTISASDLQICEGSSTQLNVTGADSYTWDNGLGTGASQTVSPTTTTTYTVVGENANGCESTEQITIDVIAAPVINVTALDNAICTGNSTSIEASGATSYSWDNGLGTGASHTVSPTVTTTYIVTGINGSNCQATESITIQVDQTPDLTVNVSDYLICEGEESAISVNGATTYSWTPTTGLSSPTGSSIIASPSVTTTYTVVGENACGTDAESLTIEVIPAPVVPVITQNGNELSVNLLAGQSAEWFLDGTLVSTGSSINMTDSGEYTVVITNSEGCSSSSTEEFEMQTSIQELSLSDLVTLFPNPTDGTFVVRFSGIEQTFNVSIIDAIGRVVVEPKNINPANINVISFDLSEFEKGVYMVVFETNEGSFTKKVTLKN